MTEVKSKGMAAKLKTLFRSSGFISFLASVVSILIGLIVGYLLLIFFNPSMSLYGLRQILFAGASSTERLAKVLYQAAPLMMTGLAVGFAFKTGLFNIGATGQFTMGTFFALFCGIVLKFPWWGALLAALIGGAVWGAWPGVFKALFNVNEVITSIMFNWIGLFAVNLMMANIPSILADFYGAANPDRTANLAAANPSAIIPKWGLDSLFNSSYMNIGILIAFLVAVVMYVILSQTTFGYELKACGLNRNASIYAGINAKRNIILSMVISGALAGLGGGIYFLSGTVQYTITKVLQPMGFNGIPVALLATSHPLGIILSSIFVSYIQVGGEAMQPEFVKEIVDIIISVIIYLSAFALLMKGYIKKVSDKWVAKHQIENASESEGMTK
jgi:general nucleoside transport system permease protein